MRRRVVLGAALALALAAVGCGEGSDGSAEGMGSTPRAVQGLNAQSKWIAGGSIALLLGNPLSATGTEASLVSVVFFDPEATGGTCADRVVDGCTVSACTGLDVATPWVSAGAITLDDGTAPLVLEPTAENRYPSGGDWQSGDVVSVRVAGDTVPAFESEAQIPEELVVHTPEFEQSFDFNVDRSIPLEVTWTGGGAATVEVVILQATGTELSEATNVVCDFPAASGAGVISPSVLSHLSTLATAQVTIAAIHRRSELVGGFSVEVDGASYPFFGRAWFR